MCIPFPQTYSMQNCDYDFSLLLQMALNKANPDEIVERDIGTANVQYTTISLLLESICDLRPAIALSLCQCVCVCVFECAWIREKLCYSFESLAGNRQVLTAACREGACTSNCLWVTTSTFQFNSGNLILYCHYFYWAQLLCTVYVKAPQEQPAKRWCVKKPTKIQNVIGLIV